jgi:hypothetical protein
LNWRNFYAKSFDSLKISVVQSIDKTDLAWAVSPASNVEIFDADEVSKKGIDSLKYKLH